MAVAPCAGLLSAFTPPRPRPRPAAARSTHRTQIAHPPSPLSPNPLPPTHRRLRRGPTLPLFSVPGNGGASETLDEASSSSASASASAEKENEPSASSASSASSDSDAGSAVAEELKEMMRARRKEASPSPSPPSDLWGGVSEEIREIEWPAFGKVVGTTGVVLAVIAGSTVALLTVNAVLAELSDRVFAGKGLQDFFG